MNTWRSFTYEKRPRWPEIQEPSTRLYLVLEKFAGHSSHRYKVSLATYSQETINGTVVVTWRDERSKSPLDNVIAWMPVPDYDWITRDWR